MFEIQVNGEPRRFNQVPSVAELLSEMGLASKRVAVECNGEIVPKSRHAETRLSSGDCVEIVVAVGGG